MCKARILSILVSCAFAQEPTCDAGEKCAPDHISLLQTSVSLTDARSHKFMNQSEERDLHVTFHSAEEKRNASRLIMKAIEDAGLSLGEWEIGSFDQHSHGLDIEHDTFPFVWDFKLRHRPSPGGEPDSSESFIEVEDKSFEESFPEDQANDSLIEVGDTSFVDEVNAMQKRTKNKNQKKWVAKALSQLEGTICDRPSNYFPKQRLVLDGFFGDECYRSEYRGRSVIPGLSTCNKHCADNEHVVGDSCAYTCGQPGLEHIGTGCLGYCAADGGACAERMARIALAFIDVLSNFIPPAKAMTAIKKAAKVGSKVAIQIAIKKAAKEVAKKLYKTAKKNLQKHIKKKRKDLKDETQDAILEGGVEMLVEARMVQDGSLESRIRDEALELAKAVDPTGIADLVDAFEADACHTKVIGEFPTSGLEDEATTDTVDVSDLPPLPPLTSGTYDVRQKVNMRYLDAYGNSDYNVVTRPAQGDTSQQWVIDAIGGGYYTIKQKWNMRYLDAYGSSHYNVVTRPAQRDSSQKWLIAPSGGGYTIRQSMNMRYLDAFEDSAHDYRSVTRTAQDNDSQEWVFMSP